MKPLIFAGVFLFGILGIWLAFWNPVDYITTGIDTGVWNSAIITDGWISICAGVVIVAIVLVLGVKVLFK